ncbi:MAG: F0F1 ATP synthase subunit A, partial [Patescibacteria group bacterium]
LFFPLLASLFLFIITANWMGLLPGVGTIGFFHGEEFTPLLRGATADLNTTLGLALVAVLAIQYFGFVTVGGHYSTRFLNFKNPIEFFLGILEMVSEVSKVISFAFRLFGNIFAGEVLLTVMAFLMPFIVPLPFLMLELFVGFIQALVFSMLTAVFLNVAVSHKGGELHHG